MTYCHVTAQLDRYLDEDFRRQQQEMAMDELRDQVEHEIFHGGCRYWCPKRESYVVVTHYDIHRRMENDDSYDRICDWFYHPDTSERTKQRIGKAYQRLLERKKSAIVEEITNAIYYYGHGL